MGFFSRIKHAAKELASNKKINAWYQVSHDHTGIKLDVNPPGKSSWSEHIRWEEIECVCLKVTEPKYSDEIYLFTGRRPESYAIPVEADGGTSILDELISRKLFHAELVTQAANAEKGTFCWPELNGYAASKKSDA